MNIEQRPIEGVLAIECSSGHSITLNQGTTHTSRVLTEGKAVVNTKSYRPGPCTVSVLDVKGEPVSSRPIILQRALKVNPVFTRRVGSVFLDLNETAKLNTVPVLKYTVRNKDRSIDFSRTHRNMVVSSQTFECPELKGYEGELRITVQALTRQGEQYIETFTVNI